MRGPTGLNLSGASKKPSFVRVIARYVFLILKIMPIIMAFFAFILAKKQNP